MVKFLSIFISFLTPYQSNEAMLVREWNRILSHYAEPHRYYHTQQHIESLLKLWQNHKKQINDPEAVFLAIIYHDLIYEPISTNNEIKSAESTAAFLTSLQYPQSKIEKIAAYIKATQTHINLENDSDLDYFLDFDLSVLGSKWADYQVYSKSIRKEFSVFSDEMYRAGRKKVMGIFLEKPRIYKTADFRVKFEHRARKNIAKEIAQL